MTNDGEFVTMLRPRHDEQDAQLPSYWRREVNLMPGAASWSPLIGDAAAFDSWCRPPAVGRVYVLADDAGEGRARQGRVEDASELPTMRKEAEAHGVQMTVLLNRTELVATEVARIRDSFGIGMKWREDDVVSTYSHAGSGIGFHIDHIDGFIVQLAGSRRWRVWRPEAAASQFHLAVLGHPGLRDLESPHRSDETPIADVELRAGDAIYVPALFPHEGTTLEGPSVSLSTAWRGLNRFRLVKDTEHAPDDVESRLGWWFGLLPDLDKAGRRVLVDGLVRELDSVEPVTDSDLRAIEQRFSI